MSVVQILAVSPVGGIFAESTKVDVFYRELCESKRKKLTVEQAFLDGAKRRIEAIAVRNTIQRMINSRDTKQGHYSAHTMNLVKQARVKYSVIPTGSDLNAIAERIASSGIIPLLVELTHHRESRYHHNYTQRLAAIIDFARKYAYSKNLVNVKL